MPPSAAPIGSSVNSVTSALDFLSRIAPTPARRQSFDIAALTAVPVKPQPATVEQLAISLVDMGLAADRTSLAVAESFARVGVPITASSISAARATLVRIPGSSPASIALATAIGVPQTPGVLRSLATVVQGVPTVEQVSPEVALQLAITISDSSARAETAMQIAGVVSQLSQSAEYRILNHEAVVSDARASLLGMVQHHHHHARGADMLARHIEGQQVLNTAARQVAVMAPFYFGFYSVSVGGRFIPVETQILAPDDERDAYGADPEASDETRLTIRVATSRLGTVEARIALKRNGRMRLELRAQTDLGARLMRRFAPDLGQSLVASGWDVRQIAVFRIREFAPLWFGGESLTQPRQRLDSRI